jgi:hypothetical protein
MSKLSLKTTLKSSVVLDLLLTKVFRYLHQLKRKSDYKVYNTPKCVLSKQIDSDLPT